MTYDRQHGSPYDRGSADAYYWRKADPHKYPHGTYNGERVKLTDPEEIEAYMAGYNEQTDRKDWG
jgi:hypothetical protein